MEDRLKNTKRLLIVFFYLTMTLYTSLSYSAPSAAQANKELTLQEYVDIDDGAFNYTAISSLKLDSATAHLLTMQSQRWRQDSEVNHVLWEHGLVVVIPDQVKTQTGLLFIWGGNNQGDLLDIDDTVLSAMHRFATATGSVVSIVRQVPNQPLVFAGAADAALSEDGLVAYTFDRAMRTHNASWPAYLPMVKSAVKAMDAISLFTKQISSETTTVKNFVVSGFSKRGATTWLTAAVDKRVIAIAPGVFDVLNFAPSMENHKRAYGEYSSAVKDYEALSILERLRTVEGQQLLKTVDPFSYRDQLDIPKYIINATGDQFFTPDSSSFYYDQLSGPKNIRYIPNTDHGGNNKGLEKLMSGLLAWYQRILADDPLPVIEWTQTDQQVTVRSDQTPTNVTLWQAHNANGRDFRLQSVGAIWQPTPMQVTVTNEYRVELQNPPTGANAYFVEFQYQNTTTQATEVYSTEVFITPESPPFTLVEPNNEPQSSRFWAMELNAAMGNLPHYEPNFDLDTLSSFLPVTVLNRTVYTVEDAVNILTDYSTLLSMGIGECLATRLNIESSKLHWYTNTGSDNNIRYLWQDWNKAHARANNGFWWLTAAKCWWLNH